MRRPRIPAPFLAALALAGCGRSAPPRPAPESRSTAPGLPTEPPAPLPTRPVNFPPFQVRSLANGARVVVVPNHEQPVVSVTLSIGNGSAADPEGKPGVASLTADLLTKGTAGRSAEEIAEATDFVGGELDAVAGQDWTTVRAVVLSEALDTGMMLLADVVLRPTFPETELEIERRRALSALEIALSDPGTLARRHFAQQVYHGHPYGRIVTAEALRSITQAHVAEFHRRFYRPSNALFVVSGDVDADAAMARLDRYFGGWVPGDSPEVELPVPSPPASRRLVFVHKPGTVQVVYRVGHLLPPASNDDWIEIAVMNQVLGKGFTSWLSRILRTEKGYTYGAYSSTEERRGPGYFEARTEVRNEVADSALAELFLALERIRSTPVSAADLGAAKSYLGGSFPLSVETPQQVAEQLSTTLLLGRPAEYLKTFRTGVQATTAEDVHRVAREYLHPDRAIIVAVGDADKVLERLGKFADTVEVYDERGKALVHGVRWRTSEQGPS